MHYPSTKYSFKELVKQLNSQIDSLITDKSKKVHFVTHSMGGILIRCYLKGKQNPNIGRVVMISPPNQGSEVVDRLKGYWIYRLINGPAGQQLGTDSLSIPNSIGPVDFEVGVITGNRTFVLDLLFSFWIPGEDDGKVSVERAKVEGMRDFLVVPHSHPFIMKNRYVIMQVVYFLKNGKFYRFTWNILESSR